MLVALLRPAIEQAPSLMRAELLNPDSFYKLVLVREYSPDAGFQYMARDNAPWGAYQHWSAVHSWTLLQAHRALRWLGIDREQSLLWAGSGITMLSMVALGILVAGVVLRQGSFIAALVAVIALASSVPLNGYGQLNQITHHVFMLVPLAAAALFLLPTSMVRTSGHLTGFLAGGLASIALWISPETMPMVVALLATRVAASMELATNEPLWPVAAGLLCVLSMGWWLDPPPPTFTTWALDHISLAWLFFALLLAILLIFVDGLGKCQLRALPKIIIASIAAIGAGLIWLQVVPDALRGPEGLIPAELKSDWWDQIEELQPVSSSAQWVAFFMLPFLSCLLLFFAAFRKKSLWMFVLAASILAYAALAFQHIRMGAASSLIAVMGYGIALSHLNVFRNVQAATKSQSLIIIIFIMVPVVQLALVSGLKNNAVDLTGAHKSAANCRLSDIAPALNSLPAGTMLTDINDGPELLWRTDHQIVAGNYHHNIKGLLDHHRLWKSVLPDEIAKQIIAERGIDYILACSGLATVPGGADRHPTLFMRATEGQHIEWLQEPVKMGRWWIYRTRTQ